MENRLKHVLVNNKNVSEELFKSKTKEEAYEIVKSLIPDYSIDEMAEDLKEMAYHTQTLSADDMKAVSGGKFSIGDIIKNLDEDTIQKIKDIVNLFLK